MRSGLSFETERQRLFKVQKLKQYLGSGYDATSMSALKFFITLSSYLIAS